MREPKLRDGVLVWEEGADHSLNDKILRPAADPFPGDRRLAPAAWQSRDQGDEGLGGGARAACDRGAGAGVPTTGRR